MRRPISPAEWDAASLRDRRIGKVPATRPTPEEYSAALAAYWAAEAARQAKSEVVTAMERIGGREWVGELAHRVYFDSLNFCSSKIGRGVQFYGYYDVSTGAYKSEDASQADDEFAETIRAALERGTFDQEIPADTFGVDGSKIEAGEPCLLVAAPLRGTLAHADASANVGRVVIPVKRVGRADFGTAWWISAGDGQPFVLSGRNVETTMQEVIVNACCLLPLRPQRYVDGVPPAPEIAVRM